MEVDERVPWFLRVESIECGVGNGFRLVVWGGARLLSEVLFGSAWKYHGCGVVGIWWFVKGILVFSHLLLISP